MTYLEAAYKILKKAKKPLHYKEITKRAIKQRFIDSKRAKTPWATMNAKISVDIQNKGETSFFIRTDPGYYFLSNKDLKRQEKITSLFKKRIDKKINRLLKGKIAEARVAELISLYSQESLICYKPISDEEGIDLIVRRKSKPGVCYLQVKSTFGYKERGFVSSVKEDRILEKRRMLLVFVYFDLSKGDLYDNLFCVPAPEFLKLTTRTKTGRRTFTVSLKCPERSKYAEFMIEKRELANRIIEIMNEL